MSARILNTVVDCEIPHQLKIEMNILYKSVETSPKQTCFKNLERKSKEANIAEPTIKQKKTAAVNIPCDVPQT